MNRMKKINLVYKIKKRKYCEKRCGGSSVNGICFNKIKLLKLYLAANLCIHYKDLTWSNFFLFKQILHVNIYQQIYLPRWLIQKSHWKAATTSCMTWRVPRSRPRWAASDQPMWRSSGSHCKGTANMSWNAFTSYKNSHGHCF